MVGILQFFHYGQASSSRKLLSPKRHNDGFEAPRNSLEFPTEASHSNQILEDDIPYSCVVKYHSTKVNGNSNGVPIRSLIDEEVSRKQDIHNRPSVIARLMGMDTLSSEINPIIDPQKRDAGMPRKGSTGATSVQGTTYVSNSTMPKNKELPPCDVELGSRKHTASPKSEKLKTREHPQEEELQKFKKEFEAWQASRMWESSRSPELGHGPGNSVENKKHDKLNDEKEFGYADEKRKLLAKRTVDERYCSATARPNVTTENREIPRHGGFMSKQTKSIIRDYYAFKESAKCNNASLFSTQDQQNTVASSKRIVIFKSFSEVNDDDAMSWLGSPEIMQKENIQDFLEQVRKKLEFEMQGKSRFNDQRMSDPGQTVKRITNQFTEISMADYKNTLAPSESSRSQRSEVQLNGHKSPQLINKDTRKLLSEKLKNVLKGESYVQFPLTADGRQSSYFSSEPETFRPMHYLDDNGNKVSFWDDKKSISPASKSSRYDHCNSAIFDDEVPPPSLVRSFSAPVSGTAVRKLLVEDKHMVTAAHVHRRHESSEDASTDVRRKDSFNIKSKVSSLRHNFALKGKLFGKKAQLMDEKGALRKEFPCMNDTLYAPSVVLKSGFAQFILENSTEVPPSPVSVCSSTYGDICRPGYPSPVSPFDATFAEDHSSSQVSEDLGTIIPDHGRSEVLDGLDIERDKAESVDEVILEVEDDAKIYIREILSVSGLLERQSLDQFLSGWDSLSKPISKWVFDRVEETYGRTGGVDNPTVLLCHGCVGISSRMLFDLLNEALLKFVQAQMASSTMRKCFYDHKIFPFNKGLLDNLWNQIQTLTKPLEENSHFLETIVAWDLSRIPWPAVYKNCTDAVGMEMEALILRDLINELVHDLIISSGGAMR